MAIKSKFTLLILVILLTFLTACGSKLDNTDTKDLNRIAEVRKKGSEVMPFDLNKTLHFFEKTVDGGDQIVILKELANTDQLNPIRKHLKEIARDFKSGDFSDPENIHGNNMPGLAILQDNYSKLTIKYIELENGAKLEYRSKDKKIVTAIHLWFDAQLGDHGSDATSSTSDIFPGFSKEHICQMHPETCRNVGDVDQPRKVK